MDRHQSHERKEAHKISEEIRHHDFKDARKELQHEAHHPKEFKKMVSQINRDLKAHHQHPLSIEHDKHGNISHLHFGKHDIFDAHQHHKHVHKPDGEKHTKPGTGDGLEKPKKTAGGEQPQADNPENKFLDPAQKKEAEARLKADKPLVKADDPPTRPEETAPQFSFLDPAQKKEAEARQKGQA